MNTCAPCRSKHATLIQNCYPKKEGETKPCSSELSYLTFYASSRPAKLTKVGAYLQKKVNNDIKKGRKDNNLVSLLILKALIQSCYGDLNIFSKYLISIFCKLLDTKDIELIDSTCETFIYYSTYNDGSTLGVDRSFTLDYETLLKKFTSFSNNVNNNHSLQLKMRYVGQRGIQAAIMSQALVSSHFNQQVDILIPSVLETLTRDKNPIQSVGETIDIRKSALNHEELDQAYIQSIAAHSLSILFSKLTALQIRQALTLVFDYITQHEVWSPSILSVTIMRISVESMQSQYKHLFVSEVLQQLNPQDILSSKQTVLVSVLDTVMNSDSSLLGVSVLEVLNSLFTLLVKVSQHPEDPKKSILVQKDLLHSIQGLAARHYYDNQLSDMAGYLVSKLKPHTTLGTVEQLPILKYRGLAISCLDMLKSLPLDAFTHGLGLLEDRDAQTRQLFCQSLYAHLQTPEPPRLLFLQQLLRAMQVWITLPNLKKADFGYFYTFLCSLNEIFGLRATVLTTSLVFKIQQNLQGTLYDSIFASLLIAWLQRTAQWYRLDLLTEYANSLEHALIEPFDLKTPEAWTLEDPPQYEVKATSVWVDRSQVVQIISSDERLRDQHDPHGLELEARLFAEWGTDASLKNKVRLIHGFSETKPKLASPGEYTPADKPLSKRNSIKVSTLKDVLATHSEESDSTTQSSLSNPSDHKSDSVNTFLTELKSPTNPGLSLVKPPYKS
ncbi:hypothetical protein BY458DRAFT_505088 [Sporodiniella umbellata]|nr:hypothetical protein BY458DRAFT_505088 [Sporodiniella umbellata]